MPDLILSSLLCLRLLCATQVLAADSEALQQALEQKISELTGSDGDVQVQVSDGIVAFTGFVQDATVIEQIETEVKGTAGVINVVSSLSAE